MADDEEYQPPENCYDLTAAFMDKTSTHAINRVFFKETSFAWKIIWFLLFLGGTGYFIQLAYDAITAFLKYPTNTSVSFEYQKKLEFPGVVVCSAGTAGLNLTEFVEYCSFAGKECNATEFEVVDDTTGAFTDCWRWNGDKDNPVKASKPGMLNGLILLLNVKAARTRPDMQGIGVIVNLQSVTRPPLPGSEGFGLAPGFGSFVSVRRQDMTNLGPPYSDCVDPSTIPRSSVDGRYSISSCLQLCADRFILKQCGCVPRPSFLPRTDGPDCSSAVDACLLDAWSKYTAGEVECECPQPCTDTNYAQMVSSVALNPDAFDWRTTATTKAEWIRDHVYALIYFQEFNVQSVSATPATDVNALLGNVGGLIGLVLGWSLMTAFEFMEYFWNAILLAVKKCRSGPVAAGEPRNAL